MTRTSKHRLFGKKGSWLGYSQPNKGFRNIPDKCRGNPSAMLDGNPGVLGKTGSAPARLMTLYGAG